MLTKRTAEIICRKWESDPSKRQLLADSLNEAPDHTVLGALHLVDDGGMLLVFKDVDVSLTLAALAPIDEEE